MQNKKKYWIMQKKDKNTFKYLDKKKIEKVIFIKNKLINILLNE